MHEKFYQVPPGFMIFQKIPLVSRKFQQVPRGFMRFWLIIVTFSPHSTKQALASWEAYECSLPGVVFLDKAHGMSRLLLKSLSDSLLVLLCYTHEASLSI